MSAILAESPADGRGAVRPGFRHWAGRSRTLPITDRPRGPGPPLVRGRRLAERAAAHRPLRPRQDALDHRPARAGCLGHGPAGAAGTASGAGRAAQDSAGGGPQLQALAPLPRLGHALLGHAGLRAGDGPRLRAGAGHRAGAHARPLADALDHRLADDPDPGHRAHDRRRPGLARPHRPRPQGPDLHLLVLLPGGDRDGEGPALARAPAARSDAHLQRQRGPGGAPSPPAGLAAVPVREPEGGRCHQRRGCDRGRAADRRPGRPGCAAADRLLLRPDGADLGRPGGGLAALGRARGPGRPRPAARLRHAPP